MNYKHGKHRTRIYSSWLHMVQRCINENDNSYDRYGGKGIKVCDRWLNFENFYKDMGERPDNTSIDRFPNNKGNYEPENCRWATPVEQALNKGLQKGKSSKFRGVSYRKDTKKWQAFFSKEKKKINLVYYDSELDAIEKATEAYYNLHGNFPPEFKPIPIPERLKCV